jgi:hypothetical protein
MEQHTTRLARERKVVGELGSGAVGKMLKIKLFLLRIYLLII